MVELESYLKSLVNDKIAPGFTYGVIYNDNVYTGAVGNKSLVPILEKIDFNSLYDMASLTKVLVVTTIISRMLDKKLIKLNDLVKKYIGEFKYDDVTILNLLTHTSGLTRLGYNDIVSKEKIINDVLNKEKTYETNQDTIYSDLNFMILGLIIENIYNKPLDKVADEEVFIPLSMNNTCYLPNKELCAPTELVDKTPLKGIVHDEKARSMDGVSGHAGLFSNVEDLIKFVNMVLNDGVVNNSVYLKKETLALWFKKISKEVKKNRYRSIGWIIGNNKRIILNHRNTISFSGFTGPSISIDMKNKVGIIMLTNRVHPSRKNDQLAAHRVLISKVIYDELKI